MCGIFGIITWDGSAKDHVEELAVMGRSLHHRGPDASGIWKEGEAALGCQRLRIVDLSASADQPFVSASERYVLVCNGEIYNAHRLRQRYAGYPFASHSDVESLLPLLDECGVAGLAQVEGMFAIAVWDRQQRRLTLVRDRAGEKPLFVHRWPGGIAFASEIQTLFAVGASRELNQQALVEYLDLGFISEPRTPFRDVDKLAAGCIETLQAGATESRRFWPEAPPPERAVGAPDPGSDKAVALEHLLSTATRRQLQGDQPVGVFLSGGVDSSLLASLVADLLAPEQRLSFSARFADERFDEESWAERAAAHCGFRHRHVRIDEESLLQAFEEVTSRIAEPMADPAILPTFLLAERARQEVPVVLGGEGADELFGGYPTYLGHRFAAPYSRTPQWIKGPFEAVVQRLPVSHAKVPLSFLLKRFIQDAGAPWQERHDGWLGPSLAEAVRNQTSAASATATAAHAEQAPWWPQQSARSDFRRAMLLDFFGYLRENLLVKLDRACMLNSVESRAPFLDVDIVRFAWQLEDHDLIRGVRTKSLLKRAAALRLPKPIVYRRKRGLSVPIADWINQGLRHEVDRLLDPQRLTSQGLFEPQVIANLLTAHRRGTLDASRRLWPFVTLQKWIDAWVPALVH